MLPKPVSHAIVTPVDKELLIYDAKRETAHCLSEVGMVVFESCQQGLSRADAVTRLQALQVADAESTLDECLNMLSERHLLKAAPRHEFDRRRFLAAAGTAVTLPVIASVLAPQPSQAVSCVECQVNASLQPLSCATCGNNCPTPGCGATSRCCFEYRVNANNPVGAGACAGLTGGTGGQEGIGIYSCRNIPGANIFNNLCDTARDQTITLFGSLAAANTQLYYCCRCPGNPVAIFTCP